MKYVNFLLLCFKAYRGDVPAGIEAAKILKEKAAETLNKLD